MAYEEKKKLIEAAKVLRKHCLNWDEGSGDCVGCIFHISKSDTCMLSEIPCEYHIPTITRWTPEDVALAKALKTIGVKTIIKTYDGEIHFFDTVYKGELLSKAVFKMLPCGDPTDLDTIIKEAKGEAL